MSNLAYSYTRFSSPPQAEGDSPRRQKDAFTTYCEANGLTPGRSFDDKGKSAFKGEHLSDTGALRGFLDLVDSGDIQPGSTLVVENLDRLSRQEVYSAFGVFCGILDAGIRIVTLPKNEPSHEFTKDKMDLGNLIMVVVEMARAHGESQRKRELGHAAFASKQALARATGKPMGAACPMWLRLKEDRSAYELIPDRAAVVERIFKLAIEGRGKEVIAKTLNEERVPSFKADNKKLQAKGFKGRWGKSSVDKVLRSRAVFGEYQPTTSEGAPKGRTINAGDPIPNYFPLVVSVDTFYEAQAAIDGRRTAKATKQSKRFNVWQKVAVCEKCGGAMHMVHKGQPPKGGSYLRCANIAKGSCKARHYRLEQAEAVFKGMLVRLDALSLVQDSSAAIEKELRVVEGEKADKTRKLHALEQRLMESPDSPAIGRAVVKMEGEVKALETRGRELEANLAAEQSIGWVEFLERLDLDSYEGRAKANTVVRRQGVIVQVGASGYLVTQDGEARFQMDFRDGKAGYLARGGFKGQFLTFVPVEEVPSIAAAEDAYYDEQDARDNEGQQLTDIEATVLQRALNEVQ